MKITTADDTKTIVESSTYRKNLYYLLPACAAFCLCTMLLLVIISRSAITIVLYGEVLYSHVDSVFVYCSLNENNFIL
jgi:hypothetical protein